MSSLILYGQTPSLAPYGTERKGLNHVHKCDTALQHQSKFRDTTTIEHEVVVVTRGRAVFHMSTQVVRAHCSGQYIDLPWFSLTTSYLTRTLNTRESAFSPINLSSVWNLSPTVASDTHTLTRTLHTHTTAHSSSMLWCFARHFLPPTHLSLCVWDVPLNRAETCLKTDPCFQRLEGGGGGGPWRERCETNLEQDVQEDVLSA